MKVERHEAEPTDIWLGRPDHECATYIAVDLYNQYTGKYTPA